MNAEPAAPADDRFVGLQTDVKLLRDQVDLLQIAATERARPWWRNPASLLSAAAFLFSLGTTYVSYVHTNQQDVNQARGELRGLIQRLNQLPRENFEAGQKYQHDSLMQGQISGFINQENAMLAKQSADVIARIPGYVSATEYLGVATALANSALTDPALRLLDAGMSVANDVNDEVALLRTRGALLFVVGQADRGRAEYARALRVFEKYPTTNTYYEVTTQALTEMYWSQTEAGARQCSVAQEHLDKAKRQLARLAPGFDASQIASQIDATYTRLADCHS